MVYAIVGLAVATFSMIIWMAVWVSGLKNEIAEATERAALWEKKHGEMEMEARSFAGETVLLKGQLVKLRASNKEILDAMESGGGNVSDIAARLRRGLS